MTETNSELLSEREKAVLYLYGMKTTHEVSYLFGISKEQVKKIIIVAVNKILANEAKPPIKGLRQINLTWDQVNPYIGGIEHLINDDLPEQHHPNVIKKPEQNSSLHWNEIQTLRDLVLNELGNSTRAHSKKTLKSTLQKLDVLMTKQQQETL